VILDAAALNRADDSMVFLCVGNGADCERIKRRATELDLGNVHFCRYSMRRISVIDGGQRRLPGDAAAVGFRDRFPSKIVTYLAAGRPIVASVNLECEVAASHTSRERAGWSSGKSIGASGRNSRIKNADLRKAGENARVYACKRWSSGRVLEHLEQRLAAAAGSEMGSLPGKDSNHEWREDRTGALIAILVAILARRFCHAWELRRCSSRCTHKIQCNLIER